MVRPLDWILRIRVHWKKTWWPFSMLWGKNKMPLLWPLVFQSRYSLNPGNGASQHKSRSVHVTGQITTPVWSTLLVYPGNLVNLHFLRRPSCNLASSPCLLGSRSRRSVLGRFHINDFEAFLHFWTHSICAPHLKNMCTVYFDKLLIWGSGTITKGWNSWTIFLWKLKWLHQPNPGTKKPQMFWEHHRQWHEVQHLRGGGSNLFFKITHWKTHASTSNWPFFHPQLWLQISHRYRSIAWCNTTLFGHQSHPN